MAKSPDAFRTISEVAEWLGVQAHVLRFWESKFSQVKPIKRAGGRRYYRPNDMLLLGGIRHLLYEDGLTIKGVQKVLREEGMNHVAALSQPLEDPALVEAEIQSPAPEARMVEEAEEERGVVLNFDAKEPAEEAKKAPQALEGEPEKPVEEAEAAAPPATEPTDESAAPETAEEAPVEASEPEDAEPAAADAGESAEAQKVETPPEEEPAAADEAAKAALPAFLRRPLEDRVAEEASEEEAASEPEAEAHPPEAEPEPEPAPAPKPRKVEVGPFRAEEDFPAEPGTLSAAYHLRRLTPEDAGSIAPLLDRLSKLRDKMASNRRNAP